MLKLLALAFYGIIINTYICKSKIFSKLEYQNLVQYWRKEINNSLHEELTGICAFNISTDFHSLSIDKTNNIIDIYINTPNYDEVLSYMHMPNRVSKSNQHILEVLETKKILDWVNVKIKDSYIPKTNPIQNRAMCYNATKSSVDSPVTFTPYISSRPGYDIKMSYLLKQNYGLLNPKGSVMFDCGFYKSFDGCYTENTPLKWFCKCPAYLQKMNISLKWFFQSSNAEAAADMLVNKKFIKYCGDGRSKFIMRDTVFTIAANNDMNYGHFLIDSLPRLARYVNLLQNNPHIFLHIRDSYLLLRFFYYVLNKAIDYYRENRKYTHNHFKPKHMMDPTSRVHMISRILKLFGIDSNRVIFGPVIAKTIFYPRVIQCVHWTSGALDIRYMGKQLLNEIKIYNPSKDSQIKTINKVNNVQLLDTRTMSVTKTNDITYIKKKIIFIQRTDMNRDWGASRRWSNNFMSELESSFKFYFSDHEILRIVSNSSLEENYCPYCEMYQFSQADIIVGTHGAALNNMVFMSPGSLIVEVISDMYNIFMPLCGYFSQLSNVMGHHHYIYSYLGKNFDKQWEHLPGEEINITELVYDVFNFYYDIRKRKNTPINFEFSLITTNNESHNFAGKCTDSSKNLPK